MFPGPPIFQSPKTMNLYVVTIQGRESPSRRTIRAHTAADALTIAEKDASNAYPTPRVHSIRCADPCPDCGGSGVVERPEWGAETCGRCKGEGVAP